MWTGEQRESVYDVTSGDELSRLRALLGISQSRLAWLLQTHRSSVAAVEAGSRDLPPRWNPWLRALQRGGPEALRRALPCFPKGTHAGNLTAAWRVLLQFA